MVQRIQYIDSIKGLAILLVVMGHVLAWNFPHDVSILFDISQPINIKVGGGTFSIDIFFSYAIILYGERILVWK